MSRQNVGMPNDRRVHVPGGSFFFTLVCERRAPLFVDARVRRLLGHTNIGTTRRSMHLDAKELAEAQLLVD